MSSISGISGSSPMMQGMGGMKRPDPAQLAEQLFSKLDSNGQGYIEKSDLKNAFDKTASTASNSQTNVDDLFSTLDGDQDGKVSKQEFSDALQKVAEQLDSQMMDKRLGRSSAGMPPPPPDAGPSLSKDELTSMASEIGSSDSAAASSLNELINNFDKADSDGDGKVSFKESQAYQQSTAATAATASTASSASDSSSNTASSSDANDIIMKQIMKLMQAYGIGATSSGSAEASSMLATISTSA
jgi:Ca2+-binding EF-hand superfamily protein